MYIELIHHPDTWHLLPTITIGSMECEDCGDSTVVVGLDFLCWSLVLFIDGHAADE